MTGFAAPTATPLPWQACLRYGALGLPLAFVALPLYILLPNHYAREFGVPLATLGWLLLGARLFDAVIDPLLGRWCDRLYAQSNRAVLYWGAGAAVLLGLGFTALFFPQISLGKINSTDLTALLAWAAAALLLTYTAYSFLSISHQSWAARLGGDEVQRSRVVAWREALGLVGVILASIVPLVLGLPSTAALFFIALALGWKAWTLAPRPNTSTATPTTPTIATAVNPASAVSTSLPSSPTTVPAISFWHPFHHPEFRRLLAVFMLNGIASAVPATLVLFFVQDRLQAPPALQPVFLGTYFVCAALSIPLWLKAVKHLGLAQCWLVGMVLSIVVFICALVLGTGDTSAFLVVCAFSGVALGTDLALPSALLAGVVQRAGDSGHAEGSYFGWWNFATKLNLALAAGLALPLLGVFGYAPGVRDPQALAALSTAYCLLPVALKLIAAILLYTLILRKSP